MRAVAGTWPDAEGAIAQIRDVFAAVTGEAEPRSIDLREGLLLLGERRPEIEAARHELREALAWLPDGGGYEGPPDPREPTDDVAANERRRIATLTPREREVLVLLVAGMGSGQIAELLVISRKTVKTHVQNILGKLHVASRLEAAAFARRHGVAASGP